MILEPQGDTTERKEILLGSGINTVRTTIPFINPSLLLIITEVGQAITGVPVHVADFEAGFVFTVVFDIGGLHGDSPHVVVVGESSAVFGADDAELVVFLLGDFPLGGEHDFFLSATLGGFGFLNLMPLVGFEPTTCGLEIRFSIQLRYKGFGSRDETRTRNLRFRKAKLYPIELPGLPLIHCDPEAIL